MIIPNDDVINSRMAICIKCDQQVDKSDDPLYFFVDLVGKIIPDAPKTMCQACSCPIWVKVRFMKNSCPLNKWDS